MCTRKNAHRCTLTIVVADYIGSVVFKWEIAVRGLNFQRNPPCLRSVYRGKRKRTQFVPYQILSHHMHRLTTKMCTTLFADRNQRLDIMPPNASHRSVSYRRCSRETLVISPGPIANGLTQCRPPVEVYPATPAEAHSAAEVHVSRRSRQ